MRNTNNTLKQELFTTICSKTLNTECTAEYRFHNKRRWRFDFALPEHKIAIEVEGGIYTRGRHVRPQGFLGDMEKYNTATAMGWKVLRVTPAKLLTTETLQLIKQTMNTK